MIYFPAATSHFRAALVAVALAAVSAWGGIVSSQTSGSWGDPNTWAPGVPGATDDVSIVTGHLVTCTGLSAVAVNSLSISGILSHADNTTTYEHRVNLDVAGDLNVAAGGRIDVTGRGFSSREGPGSPTGADRRCGASHGGSGAQGTSGTYPGPTYGSIIAPTSIGSGGAYSGVRDGGGAVLLSVGGTTRVDGLLAADGTNDLGTANGGGSGGSVFLTASNLLGHGLIRANGGLAINQNGNCGAGGGGRIAVVLTGSDSFGSVTLQAVGGTNYSGAAALAGAAGTVYTRTKDQGPNQGTLIIDNNGVGATYQTDISSLVTDASVGDVFIRDGGTLKLDADQWFIVHGSVSNGSGFACDPGSVLELAGTNSATLDGDLVIQNLVCTNAGKALLFAAGSTHTIEEGLALKGDATSNLVLRSTTNGVQWNLSVIGTAIQSVDRVDVQDSNAAIGYGTQVVATHSTDSGNNMNWFFSQVGVTNTWIGVTNTSWSDGANWDLGRQPTEFDAGIVVTNGCAFYPVLQTDRELPDFTMLSNSEFGLNGHDIVLTADARIGGRLVASGSETVTFRADADFTGGAFDAASTTVIIGGNGAQLITSDGVAFYDVTASNVTGFVTYADRLTAHDYRATATSSSFDDGVVAEHMWVQSDGSTVTQSFGAGAECVVTDLYLVGQPGATLFLRSGGVGDWLLRVSNVVYVRHVDVANSDASNGRTIHPLSSVNSGSNGNWVFDAPWKVWTGSGDDVFTNAANWNPIDAPVAGDFVLVDDPDPVTISSPATLYRMVVGGREGGAVTANGSLTLQEDLQILAGGCLSHGDNSTAETYKLNVVVTGDLTVAEGGRIDVTARGFVARQGPGGLFDEKRAGASYGGRGGMGTHTGTFYPGYTYGSALAPTNIGSGGSQYGVSDGGGAVLLTVEGSVLLDGAIMANGTNSGDNAGSGGSGGSVFLTTGALAGDGLIQADGGRALDDDRGTGAGGGGRVAVILSASDDFGEVSMQARGGEVVYGNPASAGTVYLKKASEKPGHGTVLIDNGGQSGNYSLYPPELNPERADELRRTTLVVTNTNTRLDLTTNAWVGDLFVFTNCYLNVTNYLLHVGSYEHHLDDRNEYGPGGTNRVDDYDRVLWEGAPPGFLLFIQ